MDGDNFTHTVIDKDNKVVFTGIPNTCTNRHTYKLTLTGEGFDVTNEFDDPQNIAVDLNNLFIGRTYFVNIIILHEDGKICHKIEKEFTLGGERVARDVKLKLGKIPNRWIDVSFDQPSSTTGLLRYSVRAICNDGPNREQTTEELSITMKFLKSKTEYQITVTAVYEDHECLASTSNFIQTRTPGSTGGHPFLNINGGAANIDISKSTIQHNVLTPSFDRSPDFGTVENLQESFKTDNNNFVKLFLRWNQPSFSGHQQDYFINTFQVEIFEEGGGKYGNTEDVTFNPEDQLHQYECGPLIVIGNKPYITRVKTFYENVDTALKNVSREAIKTVKSDLKTNSHMRAPMGDTLIPTISASRSSQLPVSMPSLSNVQDQKAARENVRSKWTQGKRIKRGYFADYFIASSQQITGAVEMEMTIKQADPSVIEELANRMQTVVSLDHERLLKYIEYIPDPPNYSIYMKRLDPSIWLSLEKYIREKKQGITENDAATFTLQILEGIEFLHSKMLIHGDLKCSNIFFKKFFGIKIGEFALGRILEEKLTYSSSSDEKFIQWSPEEISGHGSFAMDKSTDVWGVGCTVYEMLTGKPPLYDKEWTQRRLFTATMLIPPIPEASKQLREFLAKSMNWKKNRVPISELKNLQWITKVEKNPVEIDSRDEHNEYLYNTKYKDRIGRGTFADVWKVSTHNGKLFAIKEILVKQAKFDRLEEKGIREFNFARKKLCHKHLIEFYGCKIEEQYEGRTYILAMELMMKTLLDEIIEVGGFDEFKTRMCACEIMEGLSFLHVKEFVHRDIRGDNILISFTGVIKIADFGFKKDLQLARTEYATRDEIGAVRWMSPEAVKGNQPVTEKMDVWSLGCTIIEMLKAKPPFDRKFTELEVKEMILDGKIVQYIPTGISESLKKLLNDVFKRKPEERPAVYKLLTEYEWMGEELTPNE
ncbi:uncharacterized protein LOC144422896 [Styela clava]